MDRITSNIAEVPNCMLIIQERSKLEVQVHALQHICLYACCLTSVSTLAFWQVYQAQIFVFTVFYTCLENGKVHSGINLIYQCNFSIGGGSPSICSFLQKKIMQCFLLLTCTLNDSGCITMHLFSVQCSLCAGLQHPWDVVSIATWTLLSQSFKLCKCVLGYLLCQWLLAVLVVIILYLWCLSSTTIDQVVQFIYSTYGLITGLW